MMASGVDLDRVPAALRNCQQWLVWRFEQFKGEPKPRKVPYYASGAKRTGTQGSAKDREALVAFDVVRQLVRAGKFDGVGFAFLPNDGLIGIDLDGVIDPETGEVQPRAMEIIRACASFTEVSPSGKGVHIYCLGETKSNKSNDVGVEVFCGKQFFTVTGKQFDDTPPDVSAIAPDVLDRLHALVDAAKDKARAARRKSKPVPERKPDVVSPPTLRPGDKDAKVRSALEFVSPDLGHNDWLSVGMAIRAELGAAGFSVFDLWSSGSAKYPGSDALRRRWDSFPPDANEAALYRLAIDAGWKPPKAARPSHMSTVSGAGGGVEIPPPDVPPNALVESVRRDADWITEFRRSNNGNITPTLFNTVLLMEFDPEWRGVLGFDLFSYRVVDRRCTPPREWTDVDDVKLQLYITRRYAFEPKKQTLMDAVTTVSHDNEFHPVREWLDGLVWDGTPRLRRLFQVYFGAGYTLPRASLGADPAVETWKVEQVREWKYLEIIGIKWLVGAVARIKSPGCKLDTMVVLEGGQGARKSTSLRELFGPDWFADAKLNIGDKDALAQMQGKWCYEMAEMDAHRKADDTAFKQFLSSPVDRVRWHYGKRAEDVPRQCIFAGTTNQDYYAKDETGNRRMWPVEVSQIDVSAIRRDREQLFAEAVELWRDRTAWWIDRDVVVLDQEDHPDLDRPLSEWDLVEEQSEERQAVDAWEYPIAAWLDEHNALAKVTTAQLMGDALKLDTSRWTPPEQKRVAAIMRRRGWKQGKVGPKHARVAGWVRSGQVAEDAPQEYSGADDVPV